MNVVQKVVIITAGLSVLAGCGNNAEEKGDTAPIPVRIADVVRREVSNPVRTSGRLSTGSEMRLSFKTGGIIEGIYVREGAAVKQGEVLATLDLSEIKAGFTQARSAHDNAERDLMRMKRLYADSAITLDRFQDAETALDVAAAGLEVAEFNLEYSTITAPENGKILKKFVEENELISPGMTVFLFGGTGGKWIVRVGVIDREIVRLQLGDSADVSFDTYRGVTFPALVSEISEFADPMNGTYEVELDVDPSRYRLVSGLVAKVVIRPEEKRSYYIVPVEALVEAEGWRGFVYALDPGGETVTKRAVRIELLLGDTIAIRAGIEDVDQVVTEGAPYLDDGARVAVVER